MPLPLIGLLILFLASLGLQVHSYLRIDELQQRMTTLENRPASAPTTATSSVAASAEDKYRPESAPPHFEAQGHPEYARAAQEPPKPRNPKNAEALSKEILKRLKKRKEPLKSAAAHPRTVELVHELAARILDRPTSAEHEIDQFIEIEIKRLSPSQSELAQWKSDVLSLASSANH